MLTLDTPLSLIHGVSPRLLAHLTRLGIETVRALLYHFPFRYEDFSRIYAIADLEPGQQATIQGLVETIEVRRTWQKHIIIVEATVADETGSIRVVWFNQPYIKNVLRRGRRANFSGKVALSDEGEPYLSHPTYELTGAEETKHTARLVPIYPETRGLTSKGIRFLVQPILANLAPVPEWIPERIIRDEDLPHAHEALKAIHFPDTVEDAARASRRFAFEDLYLIQLLNLRQKAALKKELAPAIPSDVPFVKSILERLPFALTRSQKLSLWEIIQDLGKPHPMNRLLQGDVGSGKTVVAAIAGLLTARAGCQTIVMAPTEVLARQHFKTFAKLFANIPADRQPVLGLLTSAETTLLSPDDRERSVSKPAITRRVAAGEVPIVIGTHALLERSVAFKNPGLVVVDEQHRFGVNQRQNLARRHASLVPHFLSMSATPIPRTLMLTVFGDLDLSLITELPAGRKKVITTIVPPTGRNATYALVRAAIGRGRQAFVICPRIEPSTEITNHKSQITNKYQNSNFKTLETKTVKQEYEKLSKTVFPDLRVAMLHGQMKSKDKEAVMKDFRDGKADVLVSTSVIEVGVDVPNATIMLIEGSDRFGLAQLYQFRGRVGRGEHQSHCFLFTDSTARTASERLRAVIEAKNGFELAERDLKIRGPGEFLGEKQTGLPDYAMRGLQDPELVRQSREAALSTLRESPTLARYPELKARLVKFEKELHPE